MKFMIALPVTVCLSFFPLSTGHTEEKDGIYINGHDWQEWSNGSKILFVEGWVKGGLAAWNNLPINVNVLFTEKGKLMLKTQQQGLINEGVLLGGVTIGQVVDTISEMYSDPRVKMMDITEVMPFVSGRLIKGWTAKELDERVAFTVKLQRCENEEKEKGKFIEECSSLRKERIQFYKTKEDVVPKTQEGKP